jgi:hypothetical protein
MNSEGFQNIGYQPIGKMNSGKVSDKGGRIFSCNFFNMSQLCKMRNGDDALLLL